MKDELRYINVVQAVAIHAYVMEKTGYAPAPLRDEGLLEAALLRPQMAAHYEQVGLIRQAAVLAIGISQAQAFLDGNKRTAFAVCDAFLRYNGHRIAADSSIAFAKQLEAVAERDDSLVEATARFEGWLREHVAPRG